MRSGPPIQKGEEDKERRGGEIGHTLVVPALNDQPEQDDDNDGKDPDWPIAMTRVLK